MTSSTSLGESGTRRIVRPTLLAEAAIVAALLATAASGVPTRAAGEGSPEASRMEQPGGSPFGSGFGYSMMLPPGWQVTLAAGDPAGGEDLFEGPNGVSARVGGGPADPTHTVEERVAANREELTGDGICQSDPNEDSPTTLGGEVAIAWSWRCPDSYHAAVNTIHDGLRIRLQVNVPLAAEPDAAALLESLRTAFAFDEAPASTDLVALDGLLQGSYETTWHPVALELAAIEAAGIEEPGDPAWDAHIGAADTVRHVVRFEDGVISNFCAVDDGPLEACWESPYQLLDDHTIDAVSGDDHVVIEFTLNGGILTLDVVEATYGPDLAPLTATFETLPFTRIP